MYRVLPSDVMFLDGLQGLSYDFQILTVVDAVAAQTIGAFQLVDRYAVPFGYA